jgi:hypothetical protein
LPALPNQHDDTIEKHGCCTVSCFSLLFSALGDPSPIPNLQLLTFIHFIPPLILGCCVVGFRALPRFIFSVCFRDHLIGRL